MSTFKLWISLIIFSLAIPFIGIKTSELVLYGYEKQYVNSIIEYVQKDKGIEVHEDKAFLEKIKLNNMCSKSDLEEGFLEVCKVHSHLTYLKYGSYFALFFAIFALIFVSVIGQTARMNRKVLFYLFRPGLFLSQIIAATFVVANSAIIVASIYFAESFFLGRVHIVLIGFLGLAAAYAVLMVCEQALAPIKEAESRVLGKSLSASDHPSIWKFVQSIANSLGTTPPDNIIVGMEPNFFVTETKVTCLDGELKGKSLYLSLSLCRTLTRAELTAIIGHEMGHYIGNDTMWSRKFYPIYRGATETVYTLHSSTATDEKGNSDRLIQVVFLPALYFMKYFLFSFEKAEKKIGRERELNADGTGVKITSPEIMASGLLKVHVYVHAWKTTYEKMKEALAEGKKIINISVLFSSICESIPCDYMKDKIGDSHTVHPTDTHPTLATRLNAFGVKLSGFYTDNRIKLPTSDIAIELIENAEKIEEELSDIEYQILSQVDTVILKANQ